MSPPSRRTFPSTLAFGIVSCIRFRQRMRVDFPQPDGPMIAVTACSSTSIVISWIALFAPYQAERPLMLILTAIAISPGHGPRADDRAGADADHEHEEDQDEGRAPGGLVLARVRAQGERVDRVGQRLDRVVQAREAEPAAEGRHEEGGRLAGHARDAEEGPRDQAAGGGGEYDPQDRAVAGDPQGERRLPRRRRHEPQRLLRGTGHEG